MKIGPGYQWRPRCAQTLLDLTPRLLPWPRGSPSNMRRRPPYPKRRRPSYLKRRRPPYLKRRRPSYLKRRHRLCRSNHRRRCPGPCRRQCPTKLHSRRLRRHLSQPLCPNMYRSQPLFPSPRRRLYRTKRLNLPQCRTSRRTIKCRMQ